MDTPGVVLETGCVFEWEGSNRWVDYGRLVYFPNNPKLDRSPYFVIPSVFTQFGVLAQSQPIIHSQLNMPTIANIFKNVWSQKDARSCHLDVPPFGTCQAVADSFEHGSFHVIPSFRHLSSWSQASRTASALWTAASMLSIVGSLSWNNMRRVWRSVSESESGSESECDWEWERESEKQRVFPPSH